MDNPANDNSAQSPLPLIEQVSLVLNDFSDVGTPLPVADKLIFVPLVDGFAFPMLIGVVNEEGALAVKVRFVETLHDEGEAEGLLNAVAGLFGKRFTKRRRAASLIALAALETNSRGRTSVAGYDSDEGEIFVQDLLFPVNGVVVGLKERLRSLLDHVREITGFATDLWAIGFDPPGTPYSPI